MIGREPVRTPDASARGPVIQDHGSDRTFWGVRCPAKYRGRKGRRVHLSRNGPGAAGGFGLLGMTERVCRTGGQLAIDSAPGPRTGILATDPYGTPSSGPTRPEVPTIAAGQGRTVRVAIADDHPDIADVG